MRPDAFLAMRGALARGPAYCPPHLFAGPVDHIVRGLKAHANTIAHARHIALEESFPRTRSLVGEEVFHRVAEQYLTDPRMLRLPQGATGRHFPELLDGGARDLAAVEWAWLEAHGAKDMPAFDLSAIAGLDAATVASTAVVRHSSARLIELSNVEKLEWDGTSIAAPFVLVTRPRQEVVVTGAGQATATLLQSLERPQPLATLLELDPEAASALVTAGALAMTVEITL